MSKMRSFSIKRLFVWVVMGIASLALILTSGIFFYSQMTTYKQHLLERASTLTIMLGMNARQGVLNGDKIGETEKLSVLNAAHYVLNAHIYYVEDNGEISFFASYNRAGQPPIQAMYKRVQELHNPIMDENYTIEVIRPITDEGNVVAYVYVRMSGESLHNLQINSAIIMLLVIATVLTICLFITLRLQRMVTDPIENLVQVVHIIAQRKDYSQRAKKTQVRELDILIRAFNIMIGRIQDHIQAQKEAEEEYRNLATNLEETVNQRTQALKEANQELIQTLEKLHQFQRQMVENEKMASLGDMVAGVAHEVNTPIGLGVTASTMMLDRLAKIKEDFENKSLKASSLEKFITESEENLNIIYRNLNRSAELISSFKQVAVDQSSEIDRVFLFPQLMDEVLLSLKPRLKKLKHQIHFECALDKPIETKAGPLNQILINLIMNSVIHGFEDIEQGNINIVVTLNENHELQINYKDDGRGIAETIRKRIFDPFVTTKRGQGGSGLGMHLVYNLVTQALNGTITINSEEGEGVEFVITFPVHVVKPEKKLNRI